VEGDAAPAREAFGVVGKFLELATPIPCRITAYDKATIVIVERLQSSK
jgi:hypothetical protein